MEPVNGKEYPLWGQFVDKKDEWIGGVLEDFGDSTEITDITLVPNGEEDAFFEIEGKGFSCGFSTSVGGIGGDQEEPWLTFSGYGGQKFRIKKKG
jgi:hypothetical protein